MAPSWPCDTRYRRMIESATPCPPYYMRLLSTAPWGRQIEDMDWRAAARTAEGAERVRGVMRRVMAALRELMAIALATLTDPMVRRCACVFGVGGREASWTS